MCEWHMIVSNVVEEVYLVFAQHQCGRNGVHRSIAPSLVEEAAISVQVCEIVNVGF